MRNLILGPARAGQLALLSSVLAIAAVACGPQNKGATGSRAAASTATPSASATAHASYRDLVARNDIRGNAIGFSAEHKATLVVVFASWCSHCRTELAMLRELARERPALRVIGVNAYEEFDNLSDEKKLVAFLLESHPWLTVVRADDALMRKLGGVRKIPSVFVYDRDGAKLKDYRRAKRKPPTKEELAQLLDPLLG